MDVISGDIGDCITSTLSPTGDEAQYERNDDKDQDSDIQDHVNFLPLWPGSKIAANDDPCR